MFSSRHFNISDIVFCISDFKLGFFFFLVHIELIFFRFNSLFFSHIKTLYGSHSCSLGPLEMLVWFSKGCQCIFDRETQWIHSIYRGWGLGNCKFWRQHLSCLCKVVQGAVQSLAGCHQYLAAAAAFSAHEPRQCLCLWSQGWGTPAQKHNSQSPSAI